MVVERIVSNQGNSNALIVQPMAAVGENVNYS